MGCYIEFLILKEKILEIAGEEISMPVTVGDGQAFPTRERHRVLD